MLKKHRFIIILFVAVIFQTAVLNVLTFGGVHYEILFATTIFMAIKFDWRIGFYCGIWCGIAQDIPSLAPFGLSMLLYALAGILAASFQKVIFTQHISTRLLILFVMSILTTLPMMLYRSGTEVLWQFWSSFYMDVLAIAALNTLCSIPYYHFLEIWFHDDRYYRS